jgi:hypothetical protein
VSCGQNWPLKLQQLTDIPESSWVDNLLCVPTQNTINRYCPRTCSVGPGICERAGLNSTDVALVVAVEVRAELSRQPLPLVKIWFNFHLESPLTWQQCDELLCLFLLSALPKLLFQSCHDHGCWAQGGKTQVAV